MAMSLKGCGTNRMGGAQLATMTFFAPTSLAIWTISFEVVPLTIESTKMLESTTAKCRCILTIHDQYILVGKFQRHSV
jgi:hypothetical protein